MLFPFSSTAKLKMYNNTFGTQIEVNYLFSLLYLEIIASQVQACVLPVGLETAAAPVLQKYN